MRHLLMRIVLVQLSLLQIQKIKKSVHDTHKLGVQEKRNAKDSGEVNIQHSSPREDEQAILLVYATGPAFECYLIYHSLSWLKLLKTSFYFSHVVRSVGYADTNIILPCLALALNATRLTQSCSAIAHDFDSKQHLASEIVRKIKLHSDAAFPEPFRRWFL